MKFRLINNILVILNCVLAAALVLIALTPFLRPDRFWYISFLGLIYPFIAAAVVLLLLYFAIKRSRWAFLNIAALLISFQQFFVAFGLNFFSPDYSADKAPGSLRVLTWNVLQWDEMSNRIQHGGISYRGLMMDAISEQNPDIICMQEFFEPHNSVRFKSNLRELADRGYPHQFFYPTVKIWDGEAQFGMAIVSRYPIDSFSSVSFGNTPHSEGLIYADVNVNGQIIRVYSVHMESFRITNHGYANAGNNRAVQKAKGIAGSIRHAYQLRYSQNELVAEHLRSGPHKVILCGNLGDVPNSYVYFNVRNQMNDAFLAKGAGLGRTIREISPNLRVDYVLADKSFEVLQYYRPELPYSDHYPIVVDYKLPVP